MKKATQREVETVANAIKFLVPSNCGAWTPKGLMETKWPKDFSPDERKAIRLLARAAIHAVRTL